MTAYTYLDTKTEVKAISYYPNVSLSELVRKLLAEPVLTLPENEDSDVTKIITGLVKCSPLIPSSLANLIESSESLTADRKGCLDLMADPIKSQSMVFDINAPYAATYLLAILIPSMYRMKNLRADDHSFYYQWYNRGTLPTSQSHGHVISKISIVKSFLSQWFGVLPEDSQGNRYAVNPLFEMSPTQVEAMLNDPNTDWIQFIQDSLNTALKRVFDQEVLPNAHDDYQKSPVLHGSIGEYVSRMTSACCVHCGQFMIISQYTIEDKRLALGFDLSVKHSPDAVLEDCPAKKVVTRTSLVNFPSGKVLFSDLHHFDSYCDIVLSREFDINQDYDRVNASQHYAKQNIAHGSTAALTWSVFTAFDKKVIVVARHDYDHKYASVEHLSKKAYRDAIRKIDRQAIADVEQHGFSHVGYIYTDLWAYSMVDVETLKDLVQDDELVNRYVPSECSTGKTEQVGLFECVPGQYKQLYIGGHHDKEEQTMPDYILLPDAIKTKIGLPQFDRIAAIFIHESLLDDQR